MSADERLSEKQALQREKQELRISSFKSECLYERVEQGFEHGREATRLKDDQRERSGEYGRNLRDQNLQLEKNLEARGIHKLVRDISGKTAEDREQQANIQLSLDNLKYRRDQETEQLQKRQELEREELEEDINQRTEKIKNQFYGNENTQTKSNDNKEDQRIELRRQAWRSDVHENQESQTETENQSQRQGLYRGR